MPEAMVMNTFLVFRAITAASKPAMSRKLLTEIEPPRLEPVIQATPWPKKRRVERAAAGVRYRQAS